MRRVPAAPCCADVRTHDRQLQLLLLPGIDVAVRQDASLW